MMCRMKSKRQNDATQRIVRTHTRNYCTLSSWYENLIRASPIKVGARAEKYGKKLSA